MFTSLRLNIDRRKIEDIRGNEDLLNCSEFNELINNIYLFLDAKREIGEEKGGFLFSIYDEDFRGVFEIEDDLCDILIINRNMSFEDVGGEVDKITGLEKEHKFVCEVERLLHKRERFQLYIVSIDDFKSVIDVFGNSGGNYILKEFTERVIFNVISNYTIFRYSEDSFGIIREGRNEEKFVNMLKSVLDEPFEIDGKNIYITVSIGSISMKEEVNETAEDVISKSLEALQYAKEEGKNNWIEYSDGIRAQSVFELEMGMLIRDALKKNQFELYYQPQFSLSENRITGAEALIRWNHPEKGFISPGQFIPIAEKSGLIVSIGEWVLNEVSRQQREWIDRGLDIVKVSINIGSLHFKKPSFVEDIEDVLNKYSLDTSHIGLEITEGSVINNVEDMVNKLNRLRSLGVQVSIDDFGTGYSSLSYLKKFPIDILKIDQSFVVNISDDQDSMAIVKAIIGLAKDMNLKVIAEGVETESARDLLKKLDCTNMQGYFFSKPVSADEFMKVISGTIRSL